MKLLLPLGLCFITLLMSLYVRKVKSLTLEETHMYVSDLTHQNAQKVKLKLTSYFKILESISVFISNNKNFDMDYFLDVLARESKLNDFKRMGIILPDGTAYTTDGYKNNFSEDEHFKIAMNGTTNVSNTFSDKIDGKNINVYATPMYFNNNISGVIFATYASDKYQELITSGVFGGQTYILKNINEFGVLPSDNENENLLSQIENNIRKDNSAVFKANDKYISYEPIGINNWYTATVIPKAAIDSKTNELIIFTMILSTAIIIIFLALMIYMWVMQNEHNKRINKIVFDDAITKFPNREKFKLDARNILANTNNAKYAMINFDINKFKIINDLYGVAEGNRLLAYVSQVLNRHLKLGEIFARSSADNFNVLMKYETHEEIVNRIMKINEDITEFSHKYTIILAFGIYIIDDVTLDIDTLDDRAKIAKMTTKGRHDVFYAFYTENALNDIIREKEIENEMVVALTNQEFCVYLQPKYNIIENKVVGAEALIRWVKDPNKIYPPSEFIPVFEKNGFITKIDLFVFEKTCQTIRKWLDENYNPVTISVNVARLDMHDTNFIDGLYQTVLKYDIPISLIEIEITETTVLNFSNFKEFLSIVNKLKAFGFTISMDDFGSGYSSLNLLCEIPVDTLKLDKEFLNKNTNMKRGQIIIEDVVTMAKHLKMNLVAEGVETAEQVEFLKSIGCEVIQGYYFSKPLPIHDFEIKMLKGI